MSYLEAGARMCGVLDYFEVVLERQFISSPAAVTITSQTTRRAPARRKTAPPHKRYEPSRAARIRRPWYPDDRSLTEHTGCTLESPGGHSNIPFSKEKSYRRHRLPWRDSKSQRHSGGPTPHCVQAKAAAASAKQQRARVRSAIDRSSTPPVCSTGCGNTHHAGCQVQRHLNRWMSFRSPDRSSGLTELLCSQFEATRASHRPYKNQVPQRREDCCDFVRPRCRYGEDWQQWCAADAATKENQRGAAVQAQSRPTVRPIQAKLNVAMCNPSPRISHLTGRSNKYVSEVIGVATRAVPKSADSLSERCSPRARNLHPAHSRLASN